MKKILFLSALITLSILCIPHSAKAIVLANDTLIKGASFDSVYYYADGKRYVFPNEKTFFTWYSDFNSVQTITDAELATIPIGANATYHPGARMIKIQTDPKVYAVDKGGVLRWVTSEQTAKDLYGENWNTMIDDVEDYLFTNYTVGDPITSQSQFSANSVKTEIKTIRENTNSQVAAAPTPTPVPTPTPTPTPAPVAAVIPQTVEDIKLDFKIHSNNGWVTPTFENDGKGDAAVIYIRLIPTKEQIKINSLTIQNLGTANFSTSEIELRWGVIQESNPQSLAKYFKPSSVKKSEAIFNFNEPIEFPKYGYADIYIRINSSKVLTGETIKFTITQISIESLNPTKYSYSVDLPIIDEMNNKVLTK